METKLSRKYAIKHNKKYNSIVHFISTAKPSITHMWKDSKNYKNALAA
jgi:hypothetical protein